jgi:histidinol dehydrogenase
VAVAQGYAVICSGLDEAISVANQLAPEHLELLLASPLAALPRIRHAGAVFVGAGSAEVLGDYGAGPNHVLPTGTTSRYTGGLSVMTFLRMRTFLHIERPDEARELVDDAAALARLEGLEAHARSAARRRR